SLLLICKVYELFNRKDYCSGHEFLLRFESFAWIQSAFFGHSANIPENISLK
ncbi:9083_t:CDS:2, partial [Rhizophagus irregularis]